MKACLGKSIERWVEMADKTRNEKKNLLMKLNDEDGNIGHIPEEGRNANEWRNTFKSGL